MYSQPIRFLLVDDVSENLTALEALLRRDGLVIHKAHSATEALELMLVHDFKLAFVDVQMPGMNGYELAEIMRRTERTREIPIIFVTAANHNESRQFEGYEAGGIDYIYKPIDPIILRSKADIFYRLASQAHNLARQRDEMRAIAQARDLAIASLRAHADNSPLALIECDADLTVRGWSGGAERIFGIPPSGVIGRNLDQAGVFSAETLAELKDWIATSGDVARHSRETLAKGASGEMNCEIYGSVVIDPATRRPSLSLQILDTTERHQAEKVRALLVGELNHRIKNTLANVQAVMRRTLRTSASLTEFNERFTGRLQSLARAHSILSEVTWSRASLGQLIKDQIEAGMLDRDSIDIFGADVSLSPEVTLSLALILHELGTNAAKYGALSQPGGRVSLTWVANNEGLTLTWSEPGGPAVRQPERRGFGSELIESGVGDGSAQVVWRPEGVLWTVKINAGFNYDQASTAPAETSPDTEQVAPSGFDGCRVLLIEDETLIVMDLTDVLTELGAKVVKVARSVEEAVTAVKTLDVDVALLDGNLRGAPVDVVAHALRLRSIPFCFVTGYTRDQLPRDFTDVPLLSKPIEESRLREVLRDLRKKTLAVLPD